QMTPSHNHSIRYNPPMLGPVLAGSAVVGALFAAGYQSMSPTGQWYGHTFTGLPPGAKQLALTYDDGPNDPHTFRLLQVLARHNQQATFFLNGRYAQQRPDIVRVLVKAGHVIANPAFTPPLLFFKSPAEVRRELTDCRKAIEDAVGKHSNLFRPPFGGRRPAVLRIARSLGLRPIMWNVTGYDWNAPAAAAIESKVSSQVRGGDVILLHDGGHKQMGADRSQTVQAADHMVSRYQSEGFEFSTIQQMLNATTPSL